MKHLIFSILLVLGIGLSGCREVDAPPKAPDINIDSLIQTAITNGKYQQQILWNTWLNGVIDKSNGILDKGLKQGFNEEDNYHQAKMLKALLVEILELIQKDHPELPSKK